MAKEKVIEVKPQIVEPVTTAITEVPEHFHETDKIDFRFLRGKKLYIHHTIYGADAAVAANYGVFWIAPFECNVTEVREVHQILGTDASAVTLNIEKLTGTQALDNGVDVLASTIDLKGTINTVVTGTLTTTVADKQLTRGDRLAMNETGDLTALVGVTVIIEITF